MTHTAGPWLIHEGAVYAESEFKLAPFSFIDDDGVTQERPDFYDGLVALVYERGSGTANARLIAAAPDLLAALQALITAIASVPDEVLPDVNGFLGTTWNQAIAAVDKARGQAVPA